MYKIEDDHLNWCLFSKVQVEELCRQTEKTLFWLYKKMRERSHLRLCWIYDTFRSKYHKNKNRKINENFD